MGNEALNPLLRFRPIPWPGPDPASLLQFVLEIEQPALKQQVLGAYVQMSVDTLQAQLKFLGAVQKMVGQQHG